MARLRDPECGCPWDVKQDFSSLVPYLIEEAYEVVDAIEREDTEDLQEELGDLLLQVVFQSRIAQEQNLFDFEAVAGSICDKLTRRHPHVFGDIRFENDEQRISAWETAKADERARKDGDSEPSSVLDGIAQSLPALMQAEKIQNRVSRHGFDWPEIAPVFAKVEEELEEVREAFESGNAEDIREEVGDLLFVAVNLARHLNVEPEAALKQGNRKFTSRFHYIEQQVSKTGRKLKDCELAELDALWEQAKVLGK